jgi:hypothetical protein
LIVLAKRVEGVVVNERNEIVAPDLHASRLSEDEQADELIA